MRPHDGALRSLDRACLHESVVRNGRAITRLHKPYKRFIQVVAHCLVRVFVMERDRPLEEYFDEGMS